MYEVNKDRIKIFLEGCENLDPDMAEVIALLLNVDERLEKLEDQHIVEAKVRVEGLRAQLRHLDMLNAFDDKMRELGWPGEHV